MVYYFTLRLFNRIVAILQKDRPPTTRQVSPIKKNKPNVDDKQEDAMPLKKAKISDSKLQTFGKNVIGYEPFVVHEKGIDAFKKHNAYAVGRYYLK